MRCFCRANCSERQQSEQRVSGGSGANLLPERQQNARAGVPVPLQQQLTAANGGLPRPQLPVVRPQLRHSAGSAQASKVMPRAVYFYIHCKCDHHLSLSLRTL